MKYIHGRPAHLAHQVDEIGTGVVLDCGHTVDYDDLTLIVDPTDDQVAAAVAGRPIPPDPEDEAELEATIRLTSFAGTCGYAAAGPSGPCGPAAASADPGIARKIVRSQARR